VSEPIPAADPRLMLFRALDQAAGLVSGTRADQAGLPTPCTDWDVATLVRHLVGLPMRVAVAGTGGDPETVPALPDVPPEDWAADVDRAVAEARAVWADDAVLDRPMAASLDGVPGGVLAFGYTAEIVVHSWDLARATDRVAALDEEVGAAALAIAQQIMPRERGPEAEGWFAPAVTAPAGAGPYGQLAAWTGRDPG
jgi:uncharacterized protein (TIGR03086 family)